MSILVYYLGWMRLWSYWTIRAPRSRGKRRRSSYDLDGGALASQSGYFEQVDNGVRIARPEGPAGAMAPWARAAGFRVTGQAAEVAGDQLGRHAFQGRNPP